MWSASTYTSCLVCQQDVESCTLLQPTVFSHWAVDHFHDKAGRGQASPACRTIIECVGVQVGHVLPVEQSYWRSIVVFNWLAMQCCTWEMASLCLTWSDLDVPNLSESDAKEWSKTWQSKTSLPSWRPSHPSPFPSTNAVKHNHKSTNYMFIFGYYTHMPRETVSCEHANARMGAAIAALGLI